MKNDNYETKKELINDLSKVPFSSLILMLSKIQSSDTNSQISIDVQNFILEVLEKKKNKIYVDENEILLNYDFIYENNLISFDSDALDSAIQLKRELIFLNDASVQGLFDYFFRYIYSGFYDEAMFSELVITKNFNSFVRLELLNVNDRIRNYFDNQIADINNINTLLSVKKILIGMSNYQFNDIYGYLSELNEYYFRNLKKINRFINSEYTLLTPVIKRYEEMIKSGEHIVNYESDAIFECIFDVISSSKIVYFPNIKKKV